LSGMKRRVTRVLLVSQMGSSSKRAVASPRDSGGALTKGELGSQIAAFNVPVNKCRRLLPLTVVRIVAGPNEIPRF